MKTKEEFRYNMGWAGHATIPAGTKAVPATNLPGDGKYWCEPWEGMTEQEKSWMDNYGFLVYEEEVEDE